MLALHPRRRDGQRRRAMDRDGGDCHQVADLEARPVRPQIFGRAGADEIGLADDADECPGNADDRQAADVVSIHELAACSIAGGRPDDDEIEGHDVGDSVRPVSVVIGRLLGLGFVRLVEEAGRGRGRRETVGRPRAADTSMSPS